MDKQKIALLTDSCADIPQTLLRQYNIAVVPLKLIFSDGEYADGVDITPDEVYRRLPAEIPKTTLPGGDAVEGGVHAHPGSGIYPCDRGLPVGRVERHL